MEKEITDSDRIDWLMGQCSAQWYPELSGKRGVIFIAIFVTGVIAGTLLGWCIRDYKAWDDEDKKKVWIGK